jgi:hypothetical protein
MCGPTQKPPQSPQSATAAKTRYRISNHPDAGAFDSMTDATLWALQNLNNSNWKIEPVLDRGVPEPNSGLDSPC